MNDLTELGVQNLTREKHVSGVNDCNRRYLEAKRNWGHGLDKDDIS
jgi:GTP cyclohydrolase II